ncbi:MAG: 6-phosphogluconolactonase [Lentisphaerae bacterium RIFOXYA12_FULL_48_11]|nr:MAG: 6-phosphogluconolactonase [Lentisphaerae bacterium RIFOXYA12_FULL_48_11]
MKWMCLLFLCSVVSAGAVDKSFYVYIGTYTKNLSKGIYVVRFDASTGVLSKPELAAETTNPSFVAIRPCRNYIYAVGEIAQFDGKKTGAVSAFKIDKVTGKLTLLNQAESRGAGPCHVSVDKTGKYVLVANYSAGSAAVIAIKEDGSLGESTAFVQHEGSGPDEKRQKGPHAHSINLSADNRFAFVADLGLDKMMVYKFDQAKGTLVPNETPFANVQPGGGPRHFAFHPCNKYAYVINEMANTISAFSYDAATGTLKELQTVPTLPADFGEKNTTAEVVVHSSGKFVYGSNRGHNSIAVFSIDQSTGKLTFVEHVSSKGKSPRNFCVDPTGNWMIIANQDSNNILVYKIDTDTGKLTPTGQEYEVGMPVCVRFMPVE